jgi:hypothetical protein
LAEDRALAARGLATARPAAAPGFLSLSNRAERAQVLPATGGGRGLEAYRARPVPLAARPVGALASLLPRG